MAVTLRLARHGMKGAPYYRIVASEKGAKRDGNFIDRIGIYNPMTEPPVVKFVEEKLQRWLSTGARTTEVVRRLIINTHPGLMEGIEQKRLAKLRAARKARKERAKGRTAKKKK